MEDALRFRLDAIILLLAVIAAGVLAITLALGAMQAAATVFVLGGLLYAVIQRSGETPAVGSRE